MSGDKRQEKKRVNLLNLRAGQRYPFLIQQKLPKKKGKKG